MEYCPNHPADDAQRRHPGIDWAAMIGVDVTQVRDMPGRRPVAAECASARTARTASDRSAIPIASGVVTRGCRGCRRPKPHQDIDRVDATVRPAITPLEVCSRPCQRDRHAHRLFDRAESARRDPDSQPAVTEPSGTPHGGVGPASDDERNSRFRRGDDERVADREKLAVKADRLAVGEPAQDLKGLVHSTPHRPRIHTADFELVPVLTADSHARASACRGQFGDAGKLPRYQHGVTQRKKV